MKLLLTLATLIATFSVPTFAQSNKWTTKATVGMWEISMRTDKLTDKVECLVSAKDNPATQWAVEEGKLFMSTKGRQTPTYVLIRFCKSPAFNWPLSEVEKRVRSVIIEGARYTQALRDGSVYVRFRTLLDDTMDAEADLSVRDELLEK